jgi:hypothetical protein
VGNNPWNRSDATGLGDLEDAVKKLKEAKEGLEELKGDAEKLEKLIKALEGDKEAKNELIEKIGEDALDKLLGKITELLGLGGAWVKIIKGGADIGNSIGQNIAQVTAEAVCVKICETCYTAQSEGKIKPRSGVVVVPRVGTPAQAYCAEWNGQIWAKCPFKEKCSFVREVCGALGLTTETTFWQWTKCP